MSTFNVAIWAAVSTKSQAAEDKASIANQLAGARSLCQARAWPIAVEIVVPGQSREYTSLDVAMAELPELAELFALASTKKINLVVCYDLNRFRGVQVAVAKTLAAYGCQMYSLSQPVEPRPPADFVYYKSDASAIITAVGGLVSDLEIAALRRRYAIGMPHRVDTLGLHFNNKIPYGYKKTPFDKRSVPVQVPAECAIILRMKALYEAGVSLDDIAAELNEHGIPSPTGKALWQRQQIAYILINPFYAGLVARGKQTIKRDVLTGEKLRTRKPQSEWILKPGKHQGLWTPDEYDQLVALRNGRSKHLIGRTSRTFAFSRLLYCSACERLMQHHNKLRNGDDIYRCITGGWRHEGHARAHESKVIAQLREVVAGLLAAAPPPDAGAPPVDTNHLQTVRAALAENAEAKARFQRLAGRGHISDDDLVARLGELAAERTALEQQEADLLNDSKAAGRRAKVRQSAVDLMDNYDDLWKGDPADINHKLAQVFAKIVIDDHDVIEVFLRE